MPLFSIPSNTISIDSLPPVVLKGLDSAFTAASGMVMPVSLPSQVNFYVAQNGDLTVAANTSFNGYPMYVRRDQASGGGNGGEGDYKKFYCSVYTNAAGTLRIEASAPNSDASQQLATWQPVTTPVTVGAAAVKNGLTGGTTFNPGWTSIEVPFLGYAMRCVFTAGADACTVRLAWGRSV